jgi:hypothetical protein
MSRWRYPSFRTVASCLHQTCLLRSLESSRTLSSIWTVLPYRPDGSFVYVELFKIYSNWWASGRFHWAFRTVNWGSDFCWVIKCTESFKSLEIAFLMLVTLILVILNTFNSWELNSEYSGKLCIKMASPFQQQTYIVVILSTECSQ